MTDYDDIERMAQLMDMHGLEELELEQQGRRVRLRKAARIQVSADSRTRPPAGAADDAGLVVVKSPLVGTFYRASDPGAEPFVDVGSSVRRGQVLCVIEAMKLMNEIDAAENGQIVSIFVENGQPVQYGDKLFAIRLD